VRYVHLTKVKPIHKRGGYVRTRTVRVQFKKERKNSGHEPQEPRRRDELVASKSTIF
jgi:hypothetical protein